MREEEEQLKEEKREKKRKCPKETAPASKAPKKYKTQACYDAIFAPENAAKLDAATVLDSDIILAEAPNQAVLFFSI